jgi:hypothetical protein
MARALESQRDPSDMTSFVIHAASLDAVRGCMSPKTARPLDDGVDRDSLSRLPPTANTPASLASREYTQVPSMF